MERATFLSFSEPWSWSQCRPEAVKHKGTVDVGTGSPESDNKLRPIFRKKVGSSQLEKRIPDCCRGSLASGRFGPFAWPARQEPPRQRGHRACPRGKRAGYHRYQHDACLSSSFSDSCQTVSLIVCLFVCLFACLLASSSSSSSSSSFSLSFSFVGFPVTRFHQSKVHDKKLGENWLKPEHGKM